MANANMNNLTTLVKRLEAATSRLEDMATATIISDQGISTPSVIPPSPSIRAAAPTSQSATPTQYRAISANQLDQPPAQSSGSSGSAGPPQLPGTVKTYDDAVNGPLAEYMKLSQQLSPMIDQHAQLAKDCLESERKILYLAAISKKPIADMQSVFKDLMANMHDVDDYYQNNASTSDLKSHLTLIGEGIKVLLWVTLEKDAYEEAVQLWSVAPYYGNPIINKSKQKNPEHGEWVKSFYTLMNAVLKYVQENYKARLEWKSDGMEYGQALKVVDQSAAASPSPPAAAAASSSPAPPPPPPPPPPGPGPTQKSGGDIGAVFQQLNQGEAITHSLKKVSSSQQTHKNPALRDGSPLARASSQSSNKSNPPSKKPKPDSMRIKKPSQKELDGSKWYIENYEGTKNSNIELEIEGNQNQSVVISQCKHTIVKINGKVNAVLVDNSTNTSVKVDSLVSSFDVIRCLNFGLEVAHMLPTVNLDQVHGSEIYLQKDSVLSEILFSQCSSINVNVMPPDADELSDPVVLSLPEQQRCIIKDGKMTVEAVEHQGS